MADQPYMGEYSRLAAQLAARRHAPVQSVGQGLADVLGDVGEAYFAKKAAAKEKAQAGADNKSIVDALLAAGGPMSGWDAGAKMGQYGQAQSAFQNGQPQAPNLANGGQFTPAQPAFPQAPDNQKIAAALSGVRPEMQLAALPAVQDAAQQYAQAQRPKMLPAMKPGEVLPSMGPDGKITTAFAAPPETPKAPEGSPIAKLLAERDALPQGDPRRSVYDAKLANETRPPADPNAGRAQGNENTLRDEFVSQTKPYLAVRDSYENIKAAAKADTAAGDLSLIFAYMKILDPASTVREGEQATAEQARGVPDTILNLYNKVWTGQKLTKDQRKDFADRAGDIVRSQKPIFESVRTRYSELAERNGLNPKNVVFDFDLPAPPPIDPAAMSDAAYGDMSNEELLAAYAARKKK